MPSPDADPTARNAAILAGAQRLWASEWAASYDLQRRFSKEAYVKLRTAAETPIHMLPDGARVSQDEQWRAEYEISPALQAEFGSAGGVATYIAYRRGTSAEAERRAARMGAAAQHVNESAVRAQAKEKFASDAAIRAEFRSSENYEAYCAAAATGRVRVLGGSRRDET